jgi:hypothetical protein
MSSRKVGVLRHDSGLDDAFEGALERLGIERVRFSVLGPEQQRSALAEAVYASVKALDVRHKWVLEAARFSDSSLKEYSLGEIEQHHKLVHALIALVCLGESSCVRPLVAYLSFPEARWSLLIEPVLKAVSPERVPSFHGGLRQPRALQRWRSWAVTLPAAPLARTANRATVCSSANVKWDASFHCDFADPLSLIVGPDWSFGVGKAFDSDKAAACARAFYEPLRAGLFQAFIVALDERLRTDDDLAASGADTVASCIRDEVHELGARDELLTTWKRASADLAPRTNIVMFHVLNPAGADRRFAAGFVTRLVGTVRSAERQLLMGLLRREVDLGFTYRLLRACDHGHSLSPSIRLVLADASPLIARLVALSLRRALMDDTHNLCLLTNEKSDARNSLIRVVAKRRTLLERELGQLALLTEAGGPSANRIGELAAEILLRRASIDRNGDLWQLHTVEYLSKWIAALSASGHSAALRRRLAAGRSALRRTVGVLARRALARAKTA